MRRLIGSPRVRLILGVVLLLVIVGGGWALASTAQAQTAPQQPIAFSPAVMVQAGVTCLFCHSGATKSADAGIPSVAKCMGCHKVIATDSPEVQKLAGYWQRQEPIPWVRVYQLPRFVYFSHEVHVVTGGLNCETCHGDVGHMTETRAAVHMTMGWCVTCHQQQTNARQLTDCITCHQ
jgi:hypothetical protein